MIDVTHNADYRRTLLHLGFVFLFLLQKLCNYIYLLFELNKDIVLKCDLLCLFIRNILVLCDHLALHKELLYKS